MSQNQAVKIPAIRKKSKSLPILPLVDVVLFPKMVLPVLVMQHESIQLIDKAMMGDRVIGFISSRSSEIKSTFIPDDLYSIGTTALILKMAKIEENKAQLIVQGLSRFKVKKFLKDKPYLQAYVETITDDETCDNETEMYAAHVVELYKKVIRLAPGTPQEIGGMITSIKEPGILADLIISTTNATNKEKQDVLESLDIKKRLKLVMKLLHFQIEILEIGNKIQTQVKGNMDQRQKEFYLRQQLKAIQEELGEAEKSNDDITQYWDKLAAKDLPDDAIKEAKREMKRLSRMHPDSGEYTVAATYLDWIVAIPWTESTTDNLDIVRARKVLDTDHYGLEKVKKRIIEYLAVRKLKPDSKSPILCFVGPPGTGKTSLGHSIARALGRRFVRVALGGVRDEAEIRGHRRTYVGAMPGRIMQEIRRSGFNNPVFMMDEIDKVGSDFRGDPASALLEVLDPEQNIAFVDHYLDLAFDLSKVMFITTANVLHTIPPALRDRVEVLELLGYTDEEKMKIANQFLIPRQRKDHGLKANQFKITRAALKKVISDYTREAGLRNLERELASLCRSAATRIVDGKVATVTINLKNIAKYLGPSLYRMEAVEGMLTPGVAMGLAWAQNGGSILYVEATSMKGKKGLALTGQLGDIMKESASAALSYIRTNATILGIDETYFDEHDIHIHVPSGAIPKDGPSAGVTILTSLVSLMTNKTIVKDLAMTGEITLRGQLLPVGGVKEKVLAAYRAGVKTVVLPEWNRKDLEDDIPKKVINSMRFYFLDSMSDVLDIAFGRRK